MASSEASLNWKCPPSTNCISLDLFGVRELIQEKRAILTHKVIVCHSIYWFEPTASHISDATVCANHQWRYLGLLDMGTINIFFIIIITWRESAFSLKYYKLHGVHLLENYCIGTNFVWCWRAKEHSFCVETKLHWMNIKFCWYFFNDKMVMTFQQLKNHTPVNQLFGICRYVNNWERQTGFYI